MENMHYLTKEKKDRMEGFDKESTLCVWKSEDRRCIQIAKF